MGFDNECILNIQSLAGEYFCPVCRTLVYPNEALQSQCTHLYCKACLAYVISSTQSCPYDGYLVTEAGSKPLTESNKALAETIGKTPVHCLYHKSGCNWQGSLSECPSHCSGCAFGNSPVVCNRCGVQIVHRQVQEHAQTCNVNGTNTQTQPGTVSVQDSSTSGAVVASDQNKSGTQPGVHNLQSSAPQTVAVPPLGQNPNLQVNANPQSQAVAPNAVPTPEQWYQYQQYYQQYPGYDPYQQAFQQYYPYQPQAAQLQPHPQLQPTQPLAQSQSQAQVQPQPHAQLPVHSHPQTQNVPHGQPQPHPYPQAPVATQNQNQALPNQPHHNHLVQPHVQVQTQPHGSHPPPPPPQPYPQAQPHSVQTHPQQHMQGPQIQYQQAHPQIHHPQAPSQPHSHAPGHPQAQYPSHPQAQSQPHPPQANQPPPLNTPPPNQHSSSQSVTGHHSYQQPQGNQQMQHAPPQQHMTHIQPSGGSLPPMQVQSQFPQPPAHMRPLQPHAFPPNQQPPALLPSQGHASNFPPAQQQIHPNNLQMGPPIQQRPVMQPQQQMPQQYTQQAPPFTGQVSAQFQNPLYPGHFTQQQPQLRPQGPPQAVQQHPPPYIQPQHSVAAPHGMQPHLSQSHVARPAMPNHGVQLQQLPQSTGALSGPPQLRPPQHSSTQMPATPSNGNAVNNQLQAYSEQQAVQSGVVEDAKMVESKGDQTSERSVEQKDAGSPSQKSLVKDVIGLGADLAEGKSDPGMKPIGDAHKLLNEGDDSYKHKERTKDASEGYQGKDAAADPLIKQRINEEGKESSLEPSTEGGKAGDSRATGASLKQADKNVVNANLENSTEGNKAGGSQVVNSRDQLLYGPVGNESGGFQGKGFEQSSHPSQFTDHGRRQLPHMPYGPSAHQQGPPVPSMSQAVPPFGPPSDGHLQGHIPLGPLGPGQRIFELQYGAPAGLYSQGPIPSSHVGLSGMSQGEPVGPTMSAAPPGSFESHDPLMGRVPMFRDPEGQSGPPRPITPMDGNMFSNHRPPHFDGRQADSHVPGSLENGPICKPYGSESNPMGLNGAAGGMHERFKAIEDRSNPFPMRPNRRVDQPEFHDSVKPFPMSSHMGGEASPNFGNNFLSSRPMDRGPPVHGVDGSHRNHDRGSHALNYGAGRNVEPGGPGGFLPPYRPGALHPNESGERGWSAGNYDDNRGRSDSGRSNPDFLGPAPGFNQHHMDGYPPSSPGREYFGNRSRPFGGFYGGSDDIGGRDTRPFSERSGFFNLPSDSGGRALNENEFPVRPPGHMRRREYEGPENLQIGEHTRGGDLVWSDVLPSHARRGEPSNPRNIPGHPPLTEPAFGSFGHGRVGESAGPVGFPHRPFGEPFGKSSQPRLGEPGFRSSYTHQGFPNDGGPFAGDSDSYDNLRKRKPVSIGWCRICRVDCETVEGLDMHSQTREHQKMTMDMVISIKEKNGKKQKTSKDHFAREEGNRSRKVGFKGRGKKL